VTTLHRSLCGAVGSHCAKIVARASGSTSAKWRITARASASARTSGGRLPLELRHKRFPRRLLLARHRTTRAADQWCSTVRMTSELEGAYARV
jgi:hypothetical protein